LLGATISSDAVGPAITDADSTGAAGISAVVVTVHADIATVVSPTAKSDVILMVKNKFRVIHGFRYDISEEVFKARIGQNQMLLYGILILGCHLNASQWTLRDLRAGICDW